MGIIDYIKKRKDEAEAKRREQEKAEAEQRALERAKEEKLKNTIANSPIIDALFAEFYKQDWILHRQSGSDIGTRKLRITSDTVEIKWSSWRTESKIVGQNRMGINIYKESGIEDIHEQVIFSFTKSGYKPLEETDLEKKRLLADVITERIANEIPGAYSETTRLGGYENRYSEGRIYHLPSPKRELF